MKVRALKQSGLAIDCRTTVFFKKGDILQAADSKLNEKNLERLVEIGLAVEIKEGERHVDKAVEKTKADEARVGLAGGDVDSDGTANSTDSPAKSGAGIDKSVPYYRRIEDKLELDNFAKEQYGINLDRRLTLAKMMDQLDYEISQLEDGGE